MINVSKTGWLKIDNEDSIYCTLHVPTKKTRKKAVIIVGPIGPEYMHCHRSVKCLAQKIADNGFYSIRYDHLGMGDSSSDLNNGDLMCKWMNSINAIKYYALENLSIDEVIVISLRSGALILAKYMESNTLNFPIFWYPYINGKRYIRDINIIDKLLKIDITDENKNINGGGYPITPSAKKTLEEINLLNLKYKKGIELLIIEDSNVPSNTKFNHVMANNFNINNQLLPGLSEMTQQAGLSIVPQVCLEKICDWINNSNNNDEILTDKQSDISLQDLDGYDYNETVLKFTINDKSIFGILTEPKNRQYNNIILLVNAGSAHHVGPNRLNVDLARQAASLNKASFRFDLSNLGDSNYSSEESLKNPYPMTATEDINVVINELSLLYDKELRLIGLCSGAHNLFHAILNSTNNKIKQFIIINPLSFYWKQGQTISAPEGNQSEIDENYYSNQLLDINKWISLITNPSKMLNVIVFATQYIKNKIYNITYKILALLNLKQPSQLESDLISIINRNIDISFLYSDGDPGYKILNNQAPKLHTLYKNTDKFRIIKIKNADHTFSSIESRDKLITSILKSMS